MFLLFLVKNASEINEALFHVEPIVKICSRDEALMNGTEVLCVKKISLANIC